MVDRDATSRRRVLPPPEEWAARIVAGERSDLARAITLVESDRPDHRELAQNLLARLMSSTGGAMRVGITGAPGVGKSTFIEALGSWLCDRGHRLAVLAIDPSSSVSRGAILGDKTRMPKLSVATDAFVRPSPSGGSLGGVTRKSRETLLLCEAAGFDVVIVETVGVGQNEAVVADMVDSVLMLLLPGAGDELQGIKRGLLELIDVLAVNKADGDRLVAARQARLEYESGLRLVRASTAGWTPPVLLASALNNQGIEETWQAILDHRGALDVEGALALKRRRQDLRWMWSLVEEQLHEAFRTHPKVAERLLTIETEVEAGHLPPTRAALELLERFLADRQPNSAASSMARSKT